MSTGLPILLVACNQRNLELLAQFLSKSGHVTQAISDLKAFAWLLETSFASGLALVDISGFDRGIWQYCEKLVTHHIPLLIIATASYQHVQYQSYAHGAKRVLFKPLVIKELLGTVNELFLEA